MRTRRKQIPRLGPGPARYPGFDHSGVQVHVETNETLLGGSPDSSWNIPEQSRKFRKGGQLDVNKVHTDSDWAGRRKTPRSTSERHRRPAKKSSKSWSPNSTFEKPCPAEKRGVDWDPNHPPQSALQKSIWMGSTRSGLDTKYVSSRKAGKCSPGPNLCDTSCNAPCCPREHKSGIIAFLLSAFSG